ncbi:SLBB domain-containing protein [Sphingobacterium sp. UT-1RO-CII-1]|uniref:SLBB domain-containing protein n=1 Tax=Sphingobacterium sp. UT-1RO-CII-1 TaxID=2995225 RepID=UPI00227CF58A|nr:SLBB domain-containing protein [Sphingobacterium sp. UT-1RO-CII-1]MCY4780809.1 SLBB domain-containing protein [Sphingobacterium sp. UT-1RO-CII-1]
MIKQLPKIFLATFFLCCLMLAQGVAQVQQAEDLSKVRVDELSDVQVRQFMKQVRDSGLPDSQLEQMATARGMRASEVAKLKERLSRLEVTSPEKVKSNTNKVGRSAAATDTLSKNEVDSLQQLLPKSQVYGHDLFRNANPQFVPNLKIATPKSYVIGAGDQLLIDIYGDSEVSYQLEVSPDGKINIPYVGVLAVAGTDIAQVTSRIEQSLSSVYSGISSGRTKVGVSLGDIRSIQVVLTGELVQPGTYTLPSVASVFNALHAAGGPLEKASLRNVKVFRNNKLVSELDVYDFLLNGNLQGNITLQDQDIVQVSPATRRVAIDGEVNRSLFFDTKEGDTFQDLVRYAGGFTHNAYTARVAVERLTKREKRVEDVLESQFGQFTLQAGDSYHVSAILDRFENRVQMLGAVYKPGTYELTAGLSLSMLIKKADGLREDAFLKVGYIDRQKDNMEPERINFNVAEVLAGTQEDILLRKEDVVHIASIFDLRDQQTVRIEGEVRFPGVYPYAEGTQIQELIMLAGGFKEAASRSRIEVSRRVRDGDVLNPTATTAEIYHLDFDEDLAGLNERLSLQPFDLVVVRAKEGYETQKNVRIEGEVLYPGVYTIRSKDERISDLIERAGGLNAFAYAKGASLKRGGDPNNGTTPAADSLSESEKFEAQKLAEEEQERLAEVQGLAVQNNAATQRTLSQSKKNNYVGVRLDIILENNGSRDNIFLEDGDVLYIPKQLQTVRVNGEVLSPVNTVYREGLSFKDYISQAGGFSSEALRKKAYIVYANGSARSTKSFLGIKSYPKVEPGAELYVPQKPYREKMSPQAWIGMGTGVASLAAIIVSLLRK